MSSIHVGPFVGPVHAEWNATIERVTADIGSAASMHLQPAEAYQLAVQLIQAADQVTGQRRRYDLTALVEDNTMVGQEAADDDRFASSTSLVDQLGGDDDI